MTALFVYLAKVIKLRLEKATKSKKKIFSILVVEKIDSSHLCLLFVHFPFPAVSQQKVQASLKCLQIGFSFLIFTGMADMIGDLCFPTKEILAQGKRKYENFGLSLNKQCIIQFHR